MSETSIMLKLSESANDLVESYQSILKARKVRSGVDKQSVINKIIVEWGEDRILVNDVKKKP